jgi:uncharacterized protein YbjT (DUF2867 family)
MTTETILVVGATGKTGRRVSRRLHELGLPVRAGSRGAQPPFDWDDTHTWGPALTGVGAAYITYFPDIAFPGATEAVASFCKVALDHDVRRLVLLSGRGEHHAQQAEAALQGSGADWTVVRASMFQQAFSEGHLLDAVLAGEIALPAGDVTEPFISADDIAEVAVAALSEEGHVGEVYEVTGPRLIGFAEAAAEIAAATGRDIRYLPVTMAEYRAYAEQDPDLTPEFIDMLVGLMDEILDGHNAYLTDGVQRALGRAPTDFSDFVKDAAATGVWDVR